MRLSLAEDPFVFALSETNGDMQRYLATQSLDAESVRKEAAESALVVAEIMGEELTEAQAIAQANELVIEGTVTVTLEGKLDGPISRQIIVVAKTVTDADGGTEISTNTQTVEREPIS